MTDAKVILKGLIWQGLDSRRAILQTQQQTGINRDWLELWINQIHKDIQRKKRNRAIMQKFAIGWTNAQIADHYGLHQKSIARIISKCRNNAALKI